MVECAAYNSTGTWKHPSSFPKAAKLCMKPVGQKILSDDMKNLSSVRVCGLCQDNFKPTCFEKNPEILPIIGI